jgi:HK97 family phage major capsid protein
LSIKQLVNLSGMLDTDGTGGLATLPTQLQGFYGAADATRRKRLFEVLPTRRVESNQVEHFELVDFSNAAAAQAGEGTAKAEQTFDPTPITRTIATIAAWTKASEQLLEDEMWVQGTLGSLLAGLVLDKAERLCVSGSGAGGEPLGLLDIVAVVANAQSNLADAVGAQADELSNDGYEPALALVNPLDWGTQRRERAESGDGQYVLGTPGAPAPPSLWGLTVIPSPAIPVNTVLMGDTRFAVIYDRRSVSVEAARSEDDFIKNLLTIRAEVRLAPDILDPLSWRQFSIAETS